MEIEIKGQLNGQSLEIDAEGYLLDLTAWNVEIATFIAQTENIVLTAEHWEIIYWLRDFYQQFGLTPIMRVVIKEFAKQHGKDKGTSSHFMRLFSGTPLKVATKIAGLPKPTHCI